MKPNYSKLLLSFFFSFGFILLFFSSFKYGRINDDEYANDSYLRYDDYVYNDSIKSVLLFNSRSELAYPSILLNGSEKLKLSFDDLRKDSRTFFYSIIHCNANWAPSELQINEYIEGYYENEIIDYKYAFNTDLYFTHYNVQYPNENLSFTKSGNYVLKIYEENQPNKPIITKRFMVYESLLSININPHSATDVNEQFYRQEIDFTINTNKYKIPNPFVDLNVIILQNHRWDNAISNLKPKFVKDTELDYNYDNENVFDGNNEFRNFDTKSIKYQTVRVKQIKYNSIDKLEHVYLLDDKVRSYKQYLSQDDLNGNFLIKRDESTDSEVEADYIKVHFSLPYNFPIKDGNLYLFGKLSDWKFKKEFKLKYDTIEQKYTQEVLLKQGYYDYVYCFVKDGSKNTGDISVIEGSYSETINEYSVLVYHRQLSDNFDRLIGYNTVSSAN